MACPVWQRLSQARLAAAQQEVNALLQRWASWARTFFGFLAATMPGPWGSRGAKRGAEGRRDQGGWTGALYYVGAQDAQWL